MLSLYRKVSRFRTVGLILAFLVLAALGGRHPAATAPLARPAAPEMAGPPDANACFWTGATSTDWNTAGNWNSCGGGVPAAGDSVTISSAANQPTLSVPTSSLGAVTINSGATLTLGSGGTLNTASDISISGTLAGSAGAINVGGNWTKSGTFSAGTSTVTFNGTTQAIGGTSTVFSTLTIAGGSTTTANVATTASTFNINNGGTYIHTTSGGIPGTARNFGATSTYEVHSASITPASFAGVTFGNLTINFTGSTSLNLQGNLQTVHGTLKIQNTGIAQFRLTGNTNTTLTVGKVLVTGGTFVFSNGSSIMTVNVTGDVQVDSGTLQPTSSTSVPTFNVAGHWILNGGTFTPGTGTNTVIFNGTGAQTIGGAGSTTFNGVRISNTSAAVRLTNAETFSAASTVDANAVLATGGNTLTTNGALTVNGTFQIEGGGFATTSGGGNFVYGAAGTLVFNNPSGSYGVNSGHIYWPTMSGPVNVTLQGVGGITMNTARTVSGVFQTAADVTNGNQLTLNGTAQIRTGGGFSSSPVYGASSTLVYNVSGSYGVGNEWIAGSTPGSGVPKNVTIQAGTINLPNSDRTVPGNLVISGGTLALNSGMGDLFLSGNLTISGTLTTNNRAIFFQGGATQMITKASGMQTLDYLRLGKSGGAVVLGSDVSSLAPLGGNAVAFNGTVDVLDLNGHTLTLAGALGGTNAAGGFKGSSSSSLVLTGSSAMGTLRFVSGGQTLGNLTLNRSSGSVTLGSPLTVSSALSLTAGTLNTGANTLSLGGSCTLSVGSGYVLGMLTRTVAALGSFLFPVGTANGYSPLDVVATAGSTLPSDLTVTATQAAQPQMSGSTHPLLRYWTLAGSGLVADLTFHYLSADVPGLANESIYALYHYDGTSRATPGGSVNTGADTASISGMTSFPQDWTLGELPPTPTPTNTPTDIPTNTPTNTPTFTASHTPTRTHTPTIATTPVPCTTASVQAVTWVNPINVAVSGNTIQKIGTTTGWDAGAVSAQQIMTGTGYVEMTVPGTSSYSMFGLSKGDARANYTEIDYALYTYAPTTSLVVYENGAYRGSIGAYTTGDVLQVEVNAGVVRYYQNCALLYTSTVLVTTAGYPLLLDSSLSTPGSSILHAQIAGSNVQSVSTATPTTVPGSTPVTNWQNVANVSISGADLTKNTAPAGWDAGASSVLAMQSGDGYVQASVPDTTTFAMFGLSRGDTTRNYTEIDYAWYVYGAVGATPPQLYIYENATQRGSFGAYTPGMLLRVAVQGGTVRYYTGGVLRYTSTIPVPSGIATGYPMLLDASLYKGTLNNAAIGGANVSLVAALKATGSAPAFSDVTAGGPAALYPACRAGPGIVTSYVAGTFWPAALLMRGQRVRIVERVGGRNPAIPPTQ